MEILNEDEYQKALAELEWLMDAEPGSAAERRLCELAEAIEAYESVHYPIDPVDPVDALEYGMDTRGVTKSELAVCVGGEKELEKILNRERPLTEDEMRRLSEALHLPLEMFTEADGVQDDSY